MCRAPAVCSGRRRGCLGRAAACGVQGMHHPAPSPEEMPKSTLAHPPQQHILTCATSFYKRGRVQTVESIDRQPYFTLALIEGASIGAT